MERETTTIQIDQHAFTVKSYATAKEVNLIQKVYFNGAKVEIVGQEPKFSEFNPNVQYEVKVEMMRQMIVSINDVSSNPVEVANFCENLPADDFEELAVQLDAIVSKKKN